MIFNVILLSISLLGAATALPSPSVSEALVARGIDPSGPVPADAVLVPGGFTFAADSDAALWVRAQNAGLSKRDNSGLSITMWSLPSCKGSGSFIGNMPYDSPTVGQGQFLSIQYNGRALLSNEQLDLSVENAGFSDKCAHFVKSYRSSDGSGCFNGAAYSCIRLIRN